MMLSQAVNSASVVHLLGSFNQLTGQLAKNLATVAVNADVNTHLAALIEAMEQAQLSRELESFEQLMYLLPN